MPRDIAAATETAAAAASGHAFAYLAELYFDSIVTSSRIEWATLPAGDSPSIVVETSLDSGRTWTRATNGGEIPGLPAGATSHGKALLYRAYFLGGLVDANGNTYPQAALDWIEVEVNYDTGEQVLRREDSQATLSTGVLAGVEVTAAGTVQVKGEIALEFAGTGGSVRLAGGLESPLNLCRGVGVNIGGLNAEFALPGQAGIDATADRAFTLSVVAIPASGTPRQTLLRWRTYTLDLPGVHLFIEDDCVCFDAAYIFTESGDTSRPRAGSILRRTPQIPRLAKNPVEIHVIYDGVILSIWINGQPLSRQFLRRRLEDSWPGLVMTMSGDVSIGAEFDGTSSFAGKILDIRLQKGAISQADMRRYSRRRLTDVEISAHFSPDRLSPGLRAYYKCNDGEGSTLVDSAGDNDGTLRQPASGDAGVSWGTTAPLEGARTADGAHYAPYWQSLGLDLAVYGNTLNVSTLPTNLSYGDKTYLGIGALGGIEPINETSELESDGLKLTLTGIPQAHLALALQQPYQDRPCRVLQAIFGDDGLLKGAPVPLFDGRMDTMPFALGGEYATIVVTAESHLARWEDVRPLRWTATSQRERYPGDAGFDLLQATAEKTIWWPAKFARASKDAVTLLVAIVAGLLAAALGGSRT